MANVLLSTQRIQLFPHNQDSVQVDLTNVSSAPVLFHLLTTSPGRYIVKHKKGVMKPNACASITINLSKSQIPALGADTEEFIKDTFLLEYALVEPDDAIDPTFSNVSTLIKNKKKSGKVTKRQISCRVFLKGGDDDAAGGSRRMTPEEAQANTLAEKARRQSSSTALQSSGSSRLVPILALLCIVVAGILGAVWLSQ